MDNERQIKEVPMKLYLSFIIYDREGGKLPGAFSTEEKARAVIQKTINRGFYGEIDEIYTVIIDTEVGIDMKYYVLHSVWATC